MFVLKFMQPPVFYYILDFLHCVCLTVFDCAVDWLSG